MPVAGAGGVGVQKIPGFLQSLGSKAGAGILHGQCKKLPLPLYGQRYAPARRAVAHSVVQQVYHGTGHITAGGGKHGGDFLLHQRKRKPLGGAQVVGGSGKLCQPLPCRKIRLSGRLGIHGAQRRQILPGAVAGAQNGVRLPCLGGGQLVLGEKLGVAAYNSQRRF